MGPRVKTPSHVASPGGRGREVQAGRKMSLAQPELGVSFFENHCEGIIDLENKGKGCHMLRFLAFALLYYALSCLHLQCIVLHVALLCIAFIFIALHCFALLCVPLICTALLCFAPNCVELL